MPNRTDLEVVFLALSHEARRHMVLLLSHHEGELPSGYLARKFKHSWPTTTRHLRILENAGVVEVRRTGRTAMYRLRRERIEAVVGGWLSHLVPVDAKRTWRSTGPKTAAALVARATPQPDRRSKSRERSIQPQGAISP